MVVVVVFVDGVVFQVVVANGILLVLVGVVVVGVGVAIAAKIMVVVVVLVVAVANDAAFRFTAALARG